MNKRINIDWLELTFNYNPTFITNLMNNEPTIRVKTIHKSKNKNYTKGNPTYYIDHFFEVYILEPSGAVEGRTYIKILNPKLWKDLEHSIALLKELVYKYKLELLYINKMDFCIDLIGIDLLNLIDFNKPGQYKTEKGVYLKAIANEENGKTLYFNTIDIDKITEDNKVKDPEKVKGYTKQRANGKLYTKSIELDIKGNKYKQSYQNPNNEVLTRLELSFCRDYKQTKEKHLLEAMAGFIWNNTQTFINEKEYLTQYIMEQWTNLYYIELDKEPIINFNTFFDTPNQLYDYVYIQPFIDLYMATRKTYIDTIKSYRKTYIKPIFNKKVYLERIEACIKLFNNDYKTFMTEPLMLKLITDTGATHHHQLDIVKIKDNIEVNGENLHMAVHNHLYSYLERNPIKESYEVKSETINNEEDLFNLF